MYKCTERSFKQPKHKPETRVSAALKPGFRVWQNGRVSPGPGFFKTRVSIPSTNIKDLNVGVVVAIAAAALQPRK